MRKVDINNELKNIIETEAYILSIGRKLHREFGYDLNTMYIFIRLQQASDGIELRELGKMIKISASALSLRLSHNVQQGLIYVENVGPDRRTKRAYLTEQGKQIMTEVLPRLKQILNIR
ncbi:hypothetical protein ACRYI5_11000 [Furfurilactobacillus sp. WILCCON 0119]